MRYVFHLALLHVSLVFTQLIRSSDNLLEFISEMFAYISYYSLISCFLWLCVLCDNVYQSLMFYRQSQDMAYDEYFQVEFETGQQRRFKVYDYTGFVLPILMTIVTLIMTKYLPNIESFYWTSLRVDMTRLEFCYVFLPIVILMTYGVVTYTSTGILLIRAYAKEFTNFTRERNELEGKRSVFIFFANKIAKPNLNYLYLIDSWFIFDSS